MVWVVADQTINGSETGTSFKQALFFMECGFRLHDTMIYCKQNYIPLTHNRCEQAFEYMFVFLKGKPKTFNPILEKTIESGTVTNWKHKGSSVKEGAWRRRDDNIKTKETKIRNNLWYYSCGSSQAGHPAPFPEQLAADNIYTWSNEGDLVYDPFSGSGTTLKMAHLMNRKWIGSEISGDYKKAGDKRIAPHLLVNKLF